MSMVYVVICGMRWLGDGNVQVEYDRESGCKSNLYCDLSICFTMLCYVILVQQGCIQIKRKRKKGCARLSSNLEEDKIKTAPSFGGKRQIGGK